MPLSSRGRFLLLCHREDEQRVGHASYDGQCEHAHAVQHQVAAAAGGAGLPQTLLVRQREWRLISYKPFGLYHPLGKIFGTKHLIYLLSDLRLRPRKHRGLRLHRRCKR